MKRIFASFGLLMLLVMVPVPVRAASEQIQSFNTDITLNAQNVATITETIVYDFGTNQRHGIYRDIPVTYHDGDTDYYFVLHYGKTVDESGHEVKAQVTKQGDNRRVRLGDPDVTITGVHTYKIAYTLQPVVYQNQSRPFFNFDVIGTGFDVPILNASVTARTDPATAFIEPVCFSGSFGGSEPCVVEQTSPGVLTANVTNLGPGQGVTLNAYLPDGFMSTYLEPNKKPPLTAGDVWAIIGSLAIPVIVFGGLAAGGVIAILRSAKARRRRHSQTVVAQYDPPKTLTPAEVGHLSDDSSDTAEVTATIIDLARRGYMKIEQQPMPSGLSKLFGKKQDYVFHKSDKSTTDLTPPEQTLLDGLFNGQQTAQLTKLDRTVMPKAVTTFKSQVKKQLSDKGYYSTKGGVLTKGVLTDEGAVEWALVDGFKLFVNLVEKDRLAFTDAPDKTPERFSALLPYAIALGIEKQWAKQFEGIDIQQATSWYSGNVAAFSAVSFADSLNSSFASTLASNSSISSGGGSVGGGGGGGGGGSW